ncbi:MAG: methyltransferase domain-containing protein [Desulfobacteraceae bacterium]|nr:methyltransferase domain-containing protein [Desulfobacteraceae bacterium]
MSKDAKIGRKTMGGAIEQALAYHDYIYSQIRHQLGLKVFEIGSGFGQYCTKMLEDGKMVLASDVDFTFVKKLKAKIQSQKYKVMHFDLGKPETSLVEIQKFCPDTILCMNVLEHIKDDKACLKKLFDMVGKGCRFVLVVPAVPMIFNILDKEAGHYRRYDHAAVKKLLREAGWAVESVQYFNFPGILGWVLAGFLNRSPKKRDVLNSNETSGLVKIFDSCLIPITKLFDVFCKDLIGLSLVVCANKQVGHMEDREC